jgi:hypothetical protein
MPAGLALQGGGLFTMFPVTLKSSVIAQNCRTSATDADP